MGEMGEEASQELLMVVLVAGEQALRIQEVEADIPVGE